MAQQEDRSGMPSTHHARTADHAQTANRARAAVLQTGAQLLVAFTGYVTAVLLARHLGPAAYGAYGMVYSVLLAFEIVGRLGLPQALTKLVAEREAGRGTVERTGLTLGALVYLGLFALFWLGAPWLGETLHVEDGTRLFRIAALDIPFYGILFMALAVLNGRGRFSAAALATAIYALAKLIGILVLALPGVTAEGALLVNAVGSAIGLVVAAVIIGGRAWLPAFGAARRIVVFAAPVSMRGVALQLLSGIGLWSLGLAGASVPEAERGLYAAANSIARLPTVLAVGMSGVLVGSIAAAMGRGDRQAATGMLVGATRALLALLVPATVVLTVEAERAMTLIFADRFSGGGGLLAVLVVGQGLLSTLLIVVSSALVAASRAGAAAGVAAAGLAAAAVGTVLLVPAYGAMGAAVATTIGCGVAACGAGWLAAKHIGSWLSAGMAMRLAAATAPVALLAAALPGQGGWLLVELAALCVLQLGLLAAMGVIGTADLRLLAGRR